MKELKILTIGNSFAADSMQYVVEIAQNLGVEKITAGYLFYGGCSIPKHYEFAVNNLPNYYYYENNGNGWVETANVTTSWALDKCRWDYVTIQPGTGGGVRHTCKETYETLVPLLKFVKERVLSKTKIGFNLTWVGDPGANHHELISYGNNQLQMFNDILDIVSTVVKPIEDIDFIIPTGVAIQHARTLVNYNLTRDFFHLSYDKGRFLAGLTFFSAITKISVENVTFTPENVDNEFLKIALQSVKVALNHPIAN